MPRTEKYDFEIFISFYSSVHTKTCSYQSVPQEIMTLLLLTLSFI